MTHHPHIHMIVPGGGISLDGERWVSSRPAFLLPVRVLAKLFRRLFLDRASQTACDRSAPVLRRPCRLERPACLPPPLGAAPKKRWVVYAKPPFAGPEAVLAYLSRYTHRVAISNQRLISLDKTGVTFRYKDYRRDGAERQRTMTLSPTSSSAASCSTSCRRASTASGTTACSPAPATKPMSPAPGSCSHAPMPPKTEDAAPLPDLRPPCPCCGGRMVIIEIFRGRCSAARATIVVIPFTGTTAS